MPAKSNDVQVAFRSTQPCYRGQLNFYRGGLDVRDLLTLLVLMQCCNAGQLHSSLLLGNPWFFPSRGPIGNNVASQIPAYKKHTAVSNIRADISKFLSVTSLYYYLKNLKPTLFPNILFYTDAELFLRFNLQNRTPTSILSLIAQTGDLRYDHKTRSQISQNLATTLSVTILLLPLYVYFMGVFFLLYKHTYFRR
jgi:hypothetical protein